MVVAGGGFAALEAVLAVRSLAADRARVTLISPSPVLAYHPAATTESFSHGQPRAHDLEAIAADLGVCYRHDRVEAVMVQHQRVVLGSGGSLAFDALLLAIGARTNDAIAGALTFRDQRDVPAFRVLLDELQAQTFGRLVFAVPTGCSWPLPLYELALLSAKHFHHHRADVEVTLVSPEPAPLSLFGADASRLVAELLCERQVRFVGKSAPIAVDTDGALALRFDVAISADRVVAAPQLQVEPIAGVPASWWGFVPTDSVGRVEGLPDVYAAGDMTTFPIKQGGLAAQQADRAAYAIATRLGVTAKDPPEPPVLNAWLLGGDQPLLLRVELDQHGQPAAASIRHADSDDHDRAAKVFGRHLTPYLASRPTIDDRTTAA